MADEEPGTAWSEERMAAYGRAVKESPRMRRFPFLGGWAVVLLPIDLFEFRGMARMYIGTFYGFKPDELIDLRARRRTLDEDGQERTWWVIAITPEAAARRAKKARRRKAR